MTLKYRKPILNQFVSDMEHAGFDVEHYFGRNFWEGPAVRVEDRDDAQDVIRATKIKVQQDDLGKRGCIIYPIVSGTLIETDPNERSYSEEDEL